MIATCKQAEDYVYSSYLKAQPYLNYEDPDCVKRHPELVAPIIASLVDAPTVVLTGSKGKGSTCAMIDALLSCHLRVGRLTSPHLIRFNERIRVAGRCITDDEMVAAAQMVEELFAPVEASLRPEEFVSPMAIQTACALLHFKAHHCEFNVLECGKGARFDDVNSVPHEFAVITPVFLEHTRELGPTLKDIAIDKAHVIQTGQQKAFIGKQLDETLVVINERSNACGVDLRIYGRDFSARNIRLTRMGTVFDIETERCRYNGLSLPLLGCHQAENAAVALAFAEEVIGVLPEQDARDALRSIEWPGRMEILSSEPLIILDACINRTSCRYVTNALKELAIQAVQLVVCIPVDKDYIGVITEMMPYAKTVILSSSKNPHYHFSEGQVEVVAKQIKGVTPVWVPSLDEAIRVARADGNPVVILGTTSAVGEVKLLQMSGAL